MKARAARYPHLTLTLLAALLSLLAAGLLVPGCTPGPSEPTPDEAAGGAPAEPPAPVAQMEGADKAFFVMLPSGQKVTVGVFPNPDWAGYKILFDPPVPKLDANVHPIAQNALWEVFGRQRGHTSADKMRVATREKLGKIITFRLSTGSLLCVYPLSEEGVPHMQGMWIWVE